MKNATPQQKQGRRAVRLNRTLKKNLLAYAAAAGAAGVSLLALTSTAEAKIIYKKTHQVLTPNTNFQLAFQHGVNEFLLANKSSVSNYGSYDRVIVRPAPGNSFVGLSSFASALPAGSRIGASNPFYSGPINSHELGGTMAAAAYRLENGSRAEGPWLKAKNRYLGLRFIVNGQYRYGWARLSFTSKMGNQHLLLTATLTGYAYESVPNKSIITGKTDGPDVNIQRASLGALALGRK